MSNQDIQSDLSTGSGDINTLNNLEKEFIRLSPSIPCVDDSTYTQKISLSETDLLTSLQRNLSNGNIDNQSDDDLLFLEWDKERNLLQDYINSLRKEIRVLLQERVEYQQRNNSKELKSINDEQMKIDLLQKSLEEKNFVVEQLQNEYELTKEKNLNLNKKISSIQSDTKSYINTIDELKQKLADLTIDLQNQILVKRRLDMSIENLENDCKILDNERVRLTNEIKDNQHSKQDLDRYVQKANVQIAEQGSTIEMLRSENVQVRSQLSTMQRRMFQEKQQVMDYLRQIENDLIEKEQIKQRESILRQDNEQLKAQLNDLQKTTGELQQTLELLTNQCSQLEQANQAWQDYQQNQLEYFRNQFQTIVPIDDAQHSFEEILQSISNYIRQLTSTKHNDQLAHSDVSALLTPVEEGHSQHSSSIQSTPLLLSEHDDELRQLKEANQAWQQFQIDQLENFRNKVQDYVLLDEKISLDQAAQTIVNQMKNLIEDQKRDKQEIEDYKQLKTQYEQLKQQLEEIESVKDDLPTTENISPNEYLEQIVCLSSKQLLTKLRQECEQTLSKQNVQFSPSIDLNQLALLTVRCLSNEHLVNEAKQLYNETVLKALKEEYELLTNENNNLNQQIEQYEIIKDQINRFVDERLDLFPEIDENINDRLSQLISLAGNKTQMDNLLEERANHLLEIEKLTQMNNKLESVLQIFKEKINRFIIDKPDLFDGVSEETNERLDHLLSIIENEKERLKSKDTIDNESQTDDRQYEKLVQVNNKFKRALQTFKEKIHRIVVQKPELFDGIAEETSERLDHLITLVENQITQAELDQIKDQYQNRIDALENSLNTIQYELDSERRIKIEQLVTASPPANELSNSITENYEKQLAEFQQTISQKDEEQTLLRERLNEVELELSNTQIRSENSKQSQDDLIKQINEYETQLEDLKQELQSKTLPMIEKIENECQTDDRQYEKLVQMNSKLKRALQTIKEKISRLATERSDLFDGIGEETNERLDHLIATIENRATQNEINDLKTLLAAKQDQVEQMNDERNSLDQQLNEVQAELKDLQQQQDILAEQHQHEVEQLQKDHNLTREEMIRLKTTSDSQLVALQTLLEQKSDQVKQVQADLNELKNTPIVETTDSECQTDDKQHKKIVQSNNKLKAIVQTIKDKINVIVAEKPDLFDGISEDTSDRFDHLISTIESQYEQINNLQEERKQLLEKEAELQKTKDDLNRTFLKHEDQLQALKQEKDLVVEQQTEELKSLQERCDDLTSTIESQLKQIDSLQEERNQLDQKLREKVSENDELATQFLNYEDQLQTMKQEKDSAFEQEAEELKSLQEKCDDLTSTVESQLKQIDSLQKERNQIQQQLEQIVSENDNELQTVKQEKDSAFEQQVEQLKNLQEERNSLEERLRDVNDELERTKNALDTKSAEHDGQVQALKQDKDLVIEQQTEELKSLQEKYDDLTSTIESQLKQIDSLQKERNQIQQQLEQIVSENDNELQTIKLEKDSAFEQQIGQLKNLQEERNSLEERLRDVNDELERTKNALDTKSAEYNDQVQALKQESEKNSSLTSTVENQLETIHSLQEEQQLKEKLAEKDAELQKIKYEDQLKVLEQERDLLREQLRTEIDELKKTIENQEVTTSISLKSEESLQTQLHEQEKQRELVQTTDSECQTDDQQHKKLVQSNNKLKAILQTFKDKINKIVAEKPELFNDVDETASDRFDHLISTVGNQYEQISNLQDERNQLEQELQGKLAEKEVELQKVKDNLSTKSIEYEDQLRLMQQQYDDLEIFKNQQEKEAKPNDVLEILNDRINRLAMEREDLFDDIGESADERLDHLISLIENQATQINILEAERDQTEKQTNENIETLQKLTEQQAQQISELTEKTSILSTQQSRQSDDEFYECENQSDEQNTTASNIQTVDKENEQLVQINNNLNDTLQNFQDKMNRLIREKSDLFGDINDDTNDQLDRLISIVENLQIDRNELNEHLQSILVELKKTKDALTAETYKNEDQLQAFQEERDTLAKQQKHEMEQARKELKKLEEKCAAIQNNLRNEIENLKRDKDLEVDECKQQIENLTQERAELLEEIQRKTLPIVETVDSESQTDDKQHKRLVQSNNKLKGTLQTFKDKINRLATDKPELFNGIDEDTSDQLDHLISTVENQIGQITSLQVDYNRLEQQLKAKLSENDAELQKAKDELGVVSIEYEDQLETLRQEKDSSLEQQSEELKTLQKKLSEYEIERSSLDERLKQVQDELEKTKETLGTKSTEYEDQLLTLRKENESIIEQQTRLADEQQHEIERLKKDNVQIQEEVTELKKTIDQKQIETQTELEQEKNQVEKLTGERTKLLEELEKTTVSVVTLQTLNDRLDRLATEKPEIFDGIYEDKSAQLQRLISIVDTQLEQIKALNTECSTVKQQLVEKDTELRANQLETEQVREELNELKKPIDSRQIEIQTEEDINALETSLQQQSEQLKDLQEKYTNLSSQHSQLEFEFENLTQERTQLLEEIEKKTVPIVETVDSESQTDDKQHKRLVQSNNKLKGTLQTFKDKINRLVTDKPELFNGIDEDTSDQLDHLLTTVENQVTKINTLQKERDQLQQTMSEKDTEQTSLRNQLNTIELELKQQTLQSTENKREIEQLIDLNQSLKSKLNQFEDKILRAVNENSDLLNTNIEQCLDRLLSSIEQQSAQILQYQQKLNDLQKTLDEYRQQTDKHIASLQSMPNDDENEANTWFDASPDVNYETNPLQSASISPSNETNFEIIKSKLREILSEHSNSISSSSQNPFDDLKQMNSLITNLENEVIRLSSVKSPEYHHMQTQTFGLSLFEDQQKQIEKLEETQLEYQHEIERLTKQLQTIDKLDSSSNQAISRHMYEQEMLAWSKESEQLKSFVKQIQIENQKLKNIISKFETMVREYMHENERLKQENLYQSFQNSSTTNSNDENQDISYLLLKCLTYEVERREQVTEIERNNEKNDHEKQLKTLRGQNEKLKSQLESYTIHFKHIQQETGIQMAEMTKLKDEIGRLQLSDIQSRLEIDSLKTELETDKSHIQQLESQLSNQKFKQSNEDTTSLRNLCDLLRLKERELAALKEKLDYIKQAHETELREAQNAKQFSLDNVQRLERMDFIHTEKRKELEDRLKQFVQLTRALLNNKQLFIENPIINLDELAKLINETDTEERINNTLSPIRDCLGLLEAQMKELHHSIIENHARRSKRWRYKLGFECLSCDSRWEVTHDIRDLQEACLDPNRFLETSIVEPMAGCSCPIMIDFVESDVRLCINDILNDVIKQIDHSK